MKYQYFACTLLIVILLSACGRNSEPFPITVQESGDVRIITHRFGESQVPQNPQRVVALGQEYMLADLLDAGINVVASNVNVIDIAGFEEGELEDIYLFLAQEPNLETIASLNPDVIIGNDYFIQRIGYNKLSGIAPTVAIDTEGEWRRTYAETLSVFGKADEAESNIMAYEARLSAIREELNANGKLISVGTIYPDESPAAWVDGPTAVPQLLLDLGFQLSPSPDEVEDFGIRDGRVFFSLERLDLFAADTLILLQSNQVEGEEESLAEVKANPLWANLPAVQANQVFVLDRLGYPGLRGRDMLLDDVLKILE
jgi:iron complex transport system substrate-binding protein